MVLFVLLALGVNLAYGLRASCAFAEISESDFLLEPFLTLMHSVVGAE
jgi:hypothetical protein